MATAKPILLLSYLQDQLRKTRFAMTNPCLRGNELSYLRQREAAILSRIEEHPDSRRSLSITG